MADEETKKQALADIAAHLASHGPGNWAPLREKYAEVKEPTWWRWVKVVRDKLAESLPIKDAKRTLSGKVKGLPDDKKAAAVAGNLPAAPSPDYVSRAGGRVFEQIDFMAAVPELYADAEMLREFSINAEGKIKNPAYFEKSIMRRIDVLDSAVTILREIYDLQKIEAFHSVILEEIGKVSPELQEAVLKRLMDLNSKLGMSYVPGQ